MMYDLEELEADKCWEKDQSQAEASERSIAGL